jgi:UDP-N-acetylmuramate dehydrogenase
MVKIEKNVSLARYTTLGVGGNAEYFAKAISKDSLADLLKWSEAEKKPVTILGSGSNVLISDAGLDGLMIINRAIKIGIIHETATVESGASLSKLVKETIDEGLSGLEWASGIPGTVGGAIIGNAGANGGQIADVLVQAEVFHDGQVEIWHNADFDFRYRGSKLKGQAGFYLLSATFKLNPSTEKIDVSMIETDKKRRQLYFRGKTAGSYFKNPEGFAAGDLIDRAGLKGFRLGDAMVSEEHANVLKNVGNAKADDFYKLEKHIVKVVQDKFGVILQPEVVKIGKFSA